MAAAEELKLLEKLGKEDAEKFVHGAISDLCEKQGLQYEDFAKQLSLAEFSKLKRALHTTVRSLAREGGKRQEIQERLSGMGVSAELCGVVGECVWVRREEMQAQLLRDSCALSQSHLTDFDWRMKLVLSSDQLGSIQRPVLGLSLSLSDSGEKRTEHLELSREELARLITSLEAANRVVTQLRT